MSNQSIVFWYLSVCQFPVTAQTAPWRRLPLLFDAKVCYNTLIYFYELWNMVWGNGKLQRFMFNIVRSSRLQKMLLPTTPPGSVINHLLL